MGEGRARSPFILHFWGAGADRHHKFAFVMILLSCINFLQGKVPNLEVQKLCCHFRQSDGSGSIM